MKSNLLYKTKKQKKREKKTIQKQTGKRYYIIIKNIKADLYSSLWFHWMGENAHYVFMLKCFTEWVRINAHYMFMFKWEEGGEKNTLLQHKTTIFL